MANDDETVLGAEEAAPLTADRRAGTEIGGYSLDEVAGRGGMGVVYRGRHLTLQRQVAIKLLDIDLESTGSGFRERFLREARTAAAIDHPAIVPVYDAGEENGTLFIAMRWISGESLEQRIAREGALEPAQAVDILEQIGEALDAAHAQEVVHRDVKPGNMMLEGRRAYLSDFGLTKHLSSETQLTAVGQFVGTAAYIAPEQVQGKDATTQCDIYSLGCVLYEALTGRPPYVNEDQMATLFAHMSEEPEPASARNPAVPAAMDEVIAKAMSKSPANRYASAGVMMEAARAAL